MNKRVTVLVSAALVAATLGGGITTAQSPAAGTKLVAWVRNYTVDQDSPYKTAKAKFEADHPGVTVELSGVGYDPQHQRIQLSQAGAIEDKPDIFQLDNIWLGEMAEGAALNLDPYYAKWDGKSDIAAPYQESTKWNGSQYAVWAYSDIRTFLWNKDVFKAAGLDPEKPPTTWQEVMDACKTIKAALPDVWPVGFPALAQEGTVDRFYPYLFMTGATVLNEDNTKAAFNSEGGQKALQFYSDLVTNGCTSPDVLGQDPDQVFESLDSGKYAMQLAYTGDGYSTVAGTDKAATYAQHIGSALPPICDGCQPASAAGGWMLAIDKDSPNPDLAWDYIMDVTDAQNMLPFEAQYTRVPVRTSGLAQVDAFKDDPYFSVIQAAVPIAHFPPFVPQYTAVIETIWTAIQEVVSGEMSVKDALDQAAADTDAALAPAS